MTAKMDYKKSGVDVQAGDDLVDWLQTQDSKVKSSNSLEQDLTTFNLQSNKNRVLEGIGGFAALFNGQFPRMQKPTLVACTDGVGTKVKLASHFNDYSSVGFDLVGMCANDLICTGGDPLFFLDYYAVGKLNLDHAKVFLTSVKKACDESEMALIGGETAEMPGVYQQNDFDCAGFSVGVVDQDLRWGAHRVQAGQCLIGVSSSGFHSNGYSLLRKIFDSEFDQYRHWLLKPTAIYVKLVKHLKTKLNIFAAAHITGGGIENIPRIIQPDQCICLKKWDLPEEFLEVMKRTQMSEIELMKTLNCGVGFVIAIDAQERDLALIEIKKFGFKSYDLGYVDLRKNHPSEDAIVFV
jgi:phosphoribosylformylglycinamidine cyclo-ligase